jgi:hypothetical protein
MTIFAVTTGGHMTLIEARTAQSAAKQVARDIWERKRHAFKMTLADAAEEIDSVHAATDEDIDWVRGMGGRVPGEDGW